MYLNRPLIKILEDLDVPDKPFLDLQADAVERLRMTTVSPVNASTFLERNLIGKAARIPWLIRKLSHIGFQFNEDDFLRHMLELAVLIQLREIKHRSRILVEQGTTVYGEPQSLARLHYLLADKVGIMDETGYLQESEVYCSIHTDRGPLLLTGSVVVTRSPAMHPGDVQCVTAVDVPADNPLRQLHNMVVFSSHGSRDLPSQLSGGDLDGDLYNIIYDQRLYPRQLVAPALYAAATPIDIGHSVERKDITDFFVKFMENDNLGMISTLHQILADQKPNGTLDPECVRLAGLASTAVDYSKTGIPVCNQIEMRMNADQSLQVSITDLPKYPKARPDFQAPGPHVLIEENITIDDDDDSSSPLKDDELDERASFDPPRNRYYQSEKVLGRLYRDIDEHAFLKELHAHSKPQNPGGNSLLEAVWQFVRGKTALIQWRHHLDVADNIREKYTLLPFLTIYIR